MGEQLEELGDFICGAFLGDRQAELSEAEGQRRAADRFAERKGVSGGSGSCCLVPHAERSPQGKGHGEILNRRCWLLPWSEFFPFCVF